jgi:phospholipid/cholesterol/gamma-HCH transport system substrate-binding protein
MEDRAKFVLMGLFTFAVILGAFGFVYWLHNTMGNKESASYRVIFDGSVTGLRIGAPVLFNGIRVGSVTDLSLTRNPAEVAAMVEVDPATPVRKDTRVTLEYAGLTGIASVSLRGVLASAPPLPSKAGETPTLRAESNAGQDMSTAVRETLGKANAVISENQEAVHNAITNIETFSKALARNSDKLDKLVDNTNEAMTSFKQLGDHLDERTAELTTGATKLMDNTNKVMDDADKVMDNANKVLDTANKHIEIVGNDAHRAIIHIDKAVTDLAKHPQRILFGGGGGGG